jgi:hypothetical protein
VIKLGARQRHLRLLGLASDLMTAALGQCRCRDALTGGGLCSGRILSLKHRQRARNLTSRPAGVEIPQTGSTPGNASLPTAVDDSFSAVTAISAAIWRRIQSGSRLRARDASAAIFVPSKATTDRSHSPAAAHNRTPSTNRPSSARSWSTTNLAIVA